MNVILSKHWMQAVLHRRVRLLTAAVILLAALALLSACGGSAPTAAPQATAVPAATVVPAATAVPSLAPTSSPTSPESTQIETAKPPEAIAQPEVATQPEATSLSEATPTPAAATPSESVATPAETPAPTETQAPAPSPTAPAAESTATTTTQGETPACTDIAAFYGDLTVPDDTVYYQQTTFTKGWKLRNNGTCAWDAGYRLVFNSGDPLGAPLTNPLPGQIEPGQTVDLYLDMRAPDGGGTYYSNWELQNGDGQRFGVGLTGQDYFWARIKVTFLAPGESGAQPPGGETAGGSASQTTGSCEFTTNAGYVQAAITLINQARAGNGLPALSENTALDAAAQAHSQDMACNNLISHTGSDGSSWGDRIRAQGYDYARALENIYAGDPSGGAQDAVDWWLNSAVHYANIMDPDVTEIGVGFAASDNALYNGRFTADFAAP